MKHVFVLLAAEALLLLDVQNFNFHKLLTSSDDRKGGGGGGGREREGGGGGGEGGGSRLQLNKQAHAAC